MKHLSRLAGRIFNTPLAIQRSKLDAILHVLGPRFGLEGLPEIDAATLAAGKQERKPYAMTVDGIACIDVSDTLVRKASGLDALSGLTSYESLEAEWCTAMEDPEVKGVLCCFDSPGGEVGGLFDLVDKLYSYRGSKPVYASVAECAASAAYALASVCDQIFLTQTACVGSIGVWCLHFDESDFDKKVGVKYTYIFAGARKVDGNPYEPLSDEAKDVLQSEIDRTYGLFVDSVARNRKMTAKRVRDTEAGVFFGPDGVAQGLADKVGTADDAIAALRKSIGPTKPGTRKGAAMPAIAPHKTATSEASWDGPENKERLREDETQAYYEKAYAFRDPDGDPGTKSAYDFIHHEVTEGGDVEAANIKACESGIAVLNGGRGGTKLQGEDREGVYRHLAKHLRDAGQEPPELKGEAQLAADLEAEQAALAANKTKEAKVAKDDKEKDEKPKGSAADDKPKPGDEDDDEDDDKDGKDKTKKAKEKGKEEGKKEALAELAEIKELCTLAGHPDKVAEFAGMNVADVRKKLVDLRSQKSEQIELSSLVGPRSTSGKINQIEAEARDFARTKGISKERAFARLIAGNPDAYEEYRRLQSRNALLSGLGAGFQIPSIGAAQPTQYDVHVNVPLSNISVAFIQEEAKFVAADVFPNVPVLKQSDVYYTFTRADWNTSKMQPRAADGKSAGAGYRLTSNSSYLCVVQALHKDIPDQVRANMDSMLAADRDAALWLTQQFLIKRELDFVQNFLQTGIWSNNAAGGATATGTLGASNSTVMYWDNASSTPIEDVRNASRAMQSTSGGFRPTDFTLGRAVFDHLLDHPDIIDRVKYTGTEGSPAKGTKQILAELFEVDQVHVMDAVYNTGADGGTESNSLIGGKNALLSFRPKSPSLMVPSAGYTFSWTGLFGMGPMGTRLKTYREEPKAKDVVEIESAYAQKVVSADCGFFFSSVTQS